MNTKHIILPIGNLSETEADINQVIAIFIARYNDAVTVARTDLANSFYKLPTEVGSKLLETVGETEFTLPDYRIINSGRKATIAEVRQILGQYLVTPADLVKIFPDKGLNLPEFSDDQVLPWTLEMIQAMHKSPEGCIIMYQPTMNGENIDLQSFTKFQSGVSVKGDGELLYRDQFTKNGKISKKAWFHAGRESYCTQQIITGGVWRLSTKKEITGTSNKKFVPQIHETCMWMSGLGVVLPESMQSAYDDFKGKQSGLEQSQNNDYQQFLSEISQTSFWNHCMETGIETLFRLIVINQITGEKLLSNMYTRNRVSEPVDGRVGIAGYFDSDGSSLDADSPDRGWCGLGLVFSCTGK